MRVDYTTRTPNTGQTLSFEYEYQTRTQTMYWCYTIYGTHWHHVKCCNYCTSNSNFDNSAVVAVNTIMDPDYSFDLFLVFDLKIQTNTDMICNGYNNRSKTSHHMVNYNSIIVQNFSIIGQQFLNIGQQSANSFWISANIFWISINRNHFSGQRNTPYSFVLHDYKKYKHSTVFINIIIMKSRHQNWGVWRNDILDTITIMIKCAIGG